VGNSEAHDAAGQGAAVAWASSVEAQAVAPYPFCLRRTAHHEAGHAVMSYLVGCPIRAVSIEPLEGRWNGVCINGRRMPREQELQRLLYPAPLMPARLRRWLEGAVLVCLAGPIAAELAGLEQEQRSAARVDDEPDERRAEALCALLSGSERACLEAASAAAEAIPDDEEQAAAMAYALAGDLAGVTLGYLRHVARAMVYQPSFTALSGSATVTGVGFFDVIHGQTGVAPNGIELHPVVAFTKATCKSLS
jgi:hypothetical protein